MPHCGGNPIRDYFFDCSQEKDFGICSFSWLLWWQTLPNILFIWLCTKCLSYGVFMPFTILRRRLIGSRAHAPTLSTTHSSADLSSSLSCLDFRNRSSSRI